MVACAGDLERLALTGNSARRPASDMSRAYAALAMLAASLVLVAVVFMNGSGDAASRATPEQMYLLQMWQQPYHTTTTMLWNAASDDSGADMSSADHSNSFTQDLSDDSSSYEKFDTDSVSSGSGSDDSSSTSLSQILPASVLGGDGDGQAVHTHEWDTSKMSSHDNWDSHSGDHSWSGSHDSDTDKTWLGTDVKQHSWDSSQDSKLKQQLRKMYNKGINAIPKSVAKEAAEDADQSFFKKWAKVGKKITKGKTGLSDKQIKLYKEAEKSVERDEKKKDAFVKAVHKKLTTATAASAKATASQAIKHALHVKDKLKAADRLAAKLTSSGHHAAHREQAQSKPAAKAEAKEPSADPGIVGDRAAVHAIAQTKNPKAMEAKMSRLRQKIEADFDNVTKFAHAVKKSLPPLKPSQE